jgi:hypothetical protein
MGMAPGQCPLISRGKNRELLARLAHFEDLRQLGRAITHSAAQSSCRTALHGSSVRLTLLSKDNGDASTCGCAEFSTKVADALFSSSWRMLVVQFCPLESDAFARARRTAQFAT